MWKLLGLMGRHWARRWGVCEGDEVQPGGVVHLCVWFGERNDVLTSACITLRGFVWLGDMVVDDTQLSF